jgi:hypothetical protein
VRRGGERVDQPTRWIHGIRFDSPGKNTRRAHPLASPSASDHADGHPVLLARFADPFAVPY